jgi:glycosyltransferase involved in cell wall biosynthesis
MSKVLVISPDTIPVGKNLAAGPGIRSFEIARALHRKGHEITIAVPKIYYNNEEIEEFNIIDWNIWDKINLGEICNDQDCVIVPQGLGLAEFPSLYLKSVREDLPTIIDAYDPNLIEGINSLIYSEKENLLLFSNHLSALVPLLKRADFFICATERQKYYYIGILNVLGKINPLTYNKKMVDIVPFGVPEEGPIHDRNVLKGKIVDEDDLVILWTGGIYPWFDAITLVKAMENVVNEVKNAKLIFMGGKHPRMHAPPESYYKTQKLVKKSGLLNKNIFFIDQWVPWSEMQNYFLEADLAVNTHPVHLETELSFRTRVINYIWGGLPIITTGGDEISELVKKYGCGEIVKPENPDELAGIMVELLSDEKKRKRMSENAKKLAKEITWSSAIKPLDEFCRNPHIAEDRKNEFARKTVLSAVDTLQAHKLMLETEGLYSDEKTRLRFLIRTGYIFKKFGPAETARRVREYMLKTIRKKRD